VERNRKGEKENYDMLTRTKCSAPVTISDQKGEVWRLPDGSKMGRWRLPFIGETIDFMNSPFTFGLEHAKVCSLPPQEMFPNLI